MEEYEVAATHSLDWRVRTDTFIIQVLGSCEFTGCGEAYHAGDDPGQLPVGNRIPIRPSTVKKIENNSNEQI